MMSYVVVIDQFAAGGEECHYFRFAVRGKSLSNSSVPIHNQS